MGFSKSKLRTCGLVAFMAGAFACGTANAGPSICDAASGNLVQNCGFETGDFTGWGTVPAASGSNFFVGAPGNSGSFNAWFGANGSAGPDLIVQGVPTLAGHLYDLSYYYISDGSTPNLGLVGYSDGTFHLLSSSFNIPATGGWAQGDASFFATTNVTAIIFGGLDTQSFIGLDDIVLREVPEPLTIGVFGVGLAGAAAMRRRKKKSA